jgi:hypothetical protein
MAEAPRFELSDFAGIICNVRGNAIFLESERWEWLAEAKILTYFYGIFGNRVVLAKFAQGLRFLESRRLEPVLSVYSISENTIGMYSN